MNPIHRKNAAFEDCENVTIYGTGGSYAETFAREHNIPFSTGTLPKSLYSCEITVTPSSMYYTGEEQVPSVVVKDGDKTLTEGTGIATITVTVAETVGYKKASVTIKVKAAPAKQTVKSVKTAKGKKAQKLCGAWSIAAGSGSIRK